MPGEYISREKTLALLNSLGSRDYRREKGTIQDAIKMISSAAYTPAADVAEVVYGKWENGNPICPVCGENKFKDLDADIWCDWQPDFCPNCGAKMDGGNDDGGFGSAC